MRLPDDDERAPEPEAEPGGHHDRQGRWVAYEQIPRRPDRSADYDLYRYPVPCSHGCVVSGYDLDRPDEAQRRGRRLTYVGHGAVDLPQKKGTPVALVALEHQQDDAEVIYVGPSSARPSSPARPCARAASSATTSSSSGTSTPRRPGSPPASASATATCSASWATRGSPELVHLHLEARRLRDGVDLTKLAPGQMIANENSVVCDPRNVLPLR